MTRMERRAIRIGVAIGAIVGLFGCSRPRDAYRPRAGGARHPVALQATVTAP
jgi:hypothetical protein